LCCRSTLNLEAASKVRFERKDPPNFHHTLKQSISTRCKSKKKSLFLSQSIYSLRMICRINTNYFSMCHLKAVDSLINSALPMRNLHIELYMRRKSVYRRLKRNVFGGDFRRPSGLNFWRRNFFLNFITPCI